MLRDDGMFWRRLMEIQGMPDGPEKQEELRQLSLDYPGRLEDLKSQRDFYGDMATQAMPRGQVAGPASNPFSIYVGANPLEIGAASVEKFMGHRKRAESEQRTDELRSMAEGQNRKLLEAGMQKEMANQLMGLSPEEIEERRRRMMLYGGWGGGNVRA